MKGAYVATASVTTKASAEAVYAALMDPAKIKQYLFGTEVSSDWKVGSPITYRGEWQGKSYEDKGRILELIPNKRFSSTYWSSMGGLPDSPESYNTVTYDIASSRGVTTLTVTQDNIESEESASHSKSNW
jgi:uncharacterized protein YndB with AHSA1/START domain